jgi:hypothetical protein
LYWHYPHYPNQGGKPGGAVRAGDWKLIEFYENARRELIDLKADPGENRNLAEAKPDVVKKLADQLAGWRDRVGAKMPKPNPGRRPRTGPSSCTPGRPRFTGRCSGTSRSRTRRRSGTG